MSPSDISRLVDQLPKSTDPNVLVGFETADDAGVYRIDDDRALVQTLDFFPPVVDDPFDYGRIVASNSISDVYAMGGTPFSALVVAIVPRGPEWVDILRTIMQGITHVTSQDGVSLLGGHTMLGTEPAVGLSVTGFVDPERATTNAGANAGDVLVLTKPIGSGILTTAHKKGELAPEPLAVVTKAMVETNRRAAEAAAKHGIRCATDITGYGLLGHLNWMMRESGTTAVVRVGDVPVFPGTREHLAAGTVPGGTRNNLAHVSGVLACEDGIDDDTRILLADAQTSGGLVLAMPPAVVDAYRTDMPEAVVIGEVVEREEGVTIRIAP